MRVCGGRVLCELSCTGAWGNPRILLIGVPVKKKNRVRVSVCEFFMPCLLIECVTPLFGLSTCSLELLALRGEVIIPIKQPF